MGFVCGLILLFIIVLVRDFVIGFALGDGMDLTRHVEETVFL